MGCTRHTPIFTSLNPYPLALEVNTVDLMLVEGTRALCSELYQAMRERPDIFLGQNLIGSGSYRQEDAKADSRNFVDKALGGLSSKEQEDIHRLLEYLFPRMATAYAKNYTPHGHDFEKVWQEGKRVTSSGYYNRYFSYGVPSGDVSDVQLGRFFNNLSNLSRDEILQQLLGWLEEQSAATLIQKLRANIDKISSNEAAHLALSLAAMAERFPKDGSGFALISTFEQAALYVSELVKKLPIEIARVELCKQIVLASNPLVFSLSMLRWAGPREDKTSEATLSKESISTLSDVIVGRVESLIDKLKEPIYIDGSSEEDATAYLSVLARKKGKEATTHYLVATFEKDASNALRFLHRYASTWTDVATGERTARNIDTEAFDSISNVVDADTLLKWLQLGLGEDLTVEDISNYITGYVEGLKSSIDIERTLARQFAFHLTKQAQALDTNGSSEPNQHSAQRTFIK